MHVKRSRVIARVFAAAALVAATGAVGVATTAAPALAVPSNCSVGYLTSPDGYTVKCYNGTGQFRAAVYCMNDYNKATWRYGVWRSPNTDWSDAWCSSSYPYRIDQRTEKR